MCVGTLVFDFEGPRPMSVTLHHGKSLRWEAYGENLALLDPDALMDWLSARGMSFVREEYEKDRGSTEEAEARARRWRAALPAAIVPFFEGRVAATMTATTGPGCPPRSRPSCPIR